MLFGDFRVSNGPMHGAEVLANVPNPEKAEECLTEKLRVLGKVHSATSDSAVGCEFHGNASTVYVTYRVFKQIHT